MNRLKPDVNSLIESNRSYAHAIAGDVLRKLAPSADRRELQSAAELGLVEAAQGFDASRGASFKTFAYYRIRGAIYDSLRKTLDAEPVRLRFEAAANEYLGDATDAPAGSPQVELEQLKNIAGTVVGAYLISLDQMPQEVVDEDGETPEQIFAKSENRQQLRQAISSLPEKNRRLIEDYYFHDLSLEEIGRKLGLSKSWVCRLHAKSLEMVREALDSITARPPRRVATISQAAR